MTQREDRIYQAESQRSLCHEILKDNGIEFDSLEVVNTANQPRLLKILIKHSLFYLLEHNGVNYALFYDVMYKLNI